MRHTYLILACILAAVHCLPLYGQGSCNITLTVTDSLTSEPLAGAVAELLDRDSSRISYSMSKPDGNVTMKGLLSGEYILRISLLGYKTEISPVRIASDTDLGEIRMKEEPFAIESAVHSVQAIRSTQSGDTVAYNAAAYKVMFGSDSQDLISRMPGINVSEEGIDAHGRDVRRVMIDGQEYFGNDVITALKNIPADMIQEIEVINKLSDEAQLTGVDDGNSYAAINIVTKPQSRNGAAVGRLYGGYGYKDRYIAGANVNMMDKGRSLSILGMSNNISRYNFATGNIVGGSAESGSSLGKEFTVKGLPGVSSVQSAGLNFTNRWFNGSYFFNRIDNNNSYTTDKLTAKDDEVSMRTYTEGLTEAMNYSHNLTAKITLSPGERHSIIMRPTVSVQDIGNSGRQEVSFSDIIPDADPVFLRNRLNMSSSERFSIRASTTLSYRYRFEKKGRTLAITGYGSYYDNSSGSSSSQYTFGKPELPAEPDMATDSSAQNRSGLTRQAAANGAAIYTEPVGKRGRISAEYRFAYSRSEADNKVYIFNRKTGAFNGDPDTRQSGISASRFITNTAGLKYSWAFRKISLTGGASYQHTAFRGDTWLPQESSSGRTFRNIVYNATANVPFNPENSLRLNARGRTINPSVNVLQNTVNLANRSNIRSGNPEIEPTYMHEVSLRYIHTDRDAGSTFSISIGYLGSANYVCDSLVINSPDFEVTEGVILGEGNQYVKPVNLPGYSKLTWKTAYGFPFPLLRSNVNLKADAAVSRLPGMINGDRVPVRRNSYGFGMNLSSNFSEDLDFTVGWTGRLTDNEFTSKSGKTENSFLTQNITASLKWVIWKGFTFTGSFRFTQNWNMDGKYNDLIYLCDLYLGKRVFRNQRGEISFGVSDLLDNNRHRYYHTISTSGSTDGINSGTGRYISLQFVYNLRMYRK